AAAIRRLAREPLREAVERAAAEDRIEPRGQDAGRGQLAALPAQAGQGRLRLPRDRQHRPASRGQAREQRPADLPAAAEDQREGWSAGRRRRLRDGVREGFDHPPTIRSVPATGTCGDGAPECGGGVADRFDARRRSADRRRPDPWRTARPRPCVRSESRLPRAERSPTRRNGRLNSTADPRLSGRTAVPTFTGYSMLLLLLALPFVAALAIAMARGASRRTVAWLAAAAPLLGLAALGWLTPAVMDDLPLRATVPWLPEAGLALSLHLDGLAWMFAGLVLGIGALIVLYAHYYLAEEDSARRFFGCLMLFMGAMLGVVLAHNLLVLVVFWELTSISSFLLIGFWTGRQDARQGARMALTITGMGGLALLGGVLLIGRVVGSYELDAVLAGGDAIRASALYPAILGLVLAGVFTKSAQFPLHFWLPQAMAAPTPVSAYLHSATMVKAGVFLLARLHPALAGTDLFFYVVSSVGAITLLVGAWYAIFQHDLKGLLAYSTISHLGLITLLFGLST